LRLGDTARRPMRHKAVMLLWFAASCDRCTCRAGDAGGGVRVHVAMRDADDGGGVQLAQLRAVQLVLAQADVRAVKVR
jgi:hypothetical protein